MDNFVNESFGTAISFVQYADLGFLNVFSSSTLLVAILRKMCQVLMIKFLITKKAVYTLGLITLQDQKIKSNNYLFLCVGRLINILVLFLLQHLSWIERYSTMKIGRFFFV